MMHDKSGYGCNEMDAYHASVDDGPITPKRELVALKHHLLAWAERVERVADFLNKIVGMGQAAAQLRTIAAEMRKEAGEVESERD